MESAMNNREARPIVQIKISVDTEIAVAFKAACAASNVSMTAELSRFMGDYANRSVKRKAAPNYSTRRHRRTAINAMIKELVLIRACEEKIRDNTPENLQGSSSYEATEEAISTLDEAIDVLGEF